MTQPTLINLHPSEYSQKLHYYPFSVNLDRCVESCNTLDEYMSIWVCVPNKAEDLNLNVFNTITGMNESKILIKYISCKCECKFDTTKCNSKQKWNSNKCLCECKNPKEHQVCEKGYIWNPATISYENGNDYMWWNYRYGKKYFNKNSYSKKFICWY